MGRKKEKKEKQNAETFRFLSARSEFLEDDANAEEDQLKYAGIVGYCRQNNTLFHDGELPHTRKSFMSLKRELEANKEKLSFKKLKTRILATKSWNRLFSDQYCSHDADVFFDCSSVDPFIVYQGYLGDCGLVAALSAVSSRVSILETIFRLPMSLKYGVHQIRLCVDGVWRTVLVDDAIPVVGSVMMGAESKGVNWAGLIEKAIAKSRGGSYGNLDGYKSQDALGIMSGSPILAVSPNRNDCWDWLKTACGNSFPMTCATPAKDMDNQGIRTTHAYTIVECKEMEGHQLVRIRNPIGCKNWQGKWSTSWCMEQSPQSATTNFILSVSKTGDSTEFLEWADFARIFVKVWICRYRPSWHVIRAKLITDGERDGTQKMIRISVPANCDVCVSAQKKDCHRQYTYTWLMIYQVNEEDPLSIGEIVTCELIHEYSKDIRLVAGDYVINFADLRYANKTERNVAIHSSKPISAMFIDSNPFTQTQMVQRIVEERGKEVSGNESGDMSIKKFKAIDNNATIMIMATNYSYQRYLHVHLFSGAKMQTNWYTSRWHEECLADVIPPRSRQILLVTKPTLRQNPEFASRIDYWFSDEKLTGIGRSKRAAHIPGIGSWDYLHFTTVID